MLGAGADSLVYVVADYVFLDAAAAAQFTSSVALEQASFAAAIVSALLADPTAAALLPGLEVVGLVVNVVMPSTSNAPAAVVGDAGGGLQWWYLAVTGIGAIVVGVAGTILAWRLSRWLNPQSGARVAPMDSVPVVSARSELVANEDCVVAPVVPLPPEAGEQIPPLAAHSATPADAAVGSHGGTRVPSVADAVPAAAAAASTPPSPPSGDMLPDGVVPEHVLARKLVEDMDRAALSEPVAVPATSDHGDTPAATPSRLPQLVLPAASASLHHRDTARGMGAALDSLLATPPDDPAPTPAVDVITSPSAPATSRAQRSLLAPEPPVPLLPHLVAMPASPSDAATDADADVETQHPATVPGVLDSPPVALVTPAPDTRIATTTHLPPIASALRRASPGVPPAVAVVIMCDDAVAEVAISHPAGVPSRRGSSEQPTTPPRPLLPPVAAVVVPDASAPPPPVAVTVHLPASPRAAASVRAPTSVDVDADVAYLMKAGRVGSMATLWQLSDLADGASGGSVPRSSHGAGDDDTIEVAVMHDDRPAAPVLSHHLPGRLGRSPGAVKSREEHILEAAADAIVEGMMADAAAAPLPPLPTPPLRASRSAGRRPQGTTGGAAADAPRRTADARSVLRSLHAEFRQPGELVVARASAPALPRHPPAAAAPAADDLLFDELPARPLPPARYPPAPIGVISTHGAAPRRHHARPPPYAAVVDDTAADDPPPAYIPLTVRGGPGGGARHASAHLPPRSASRAWHGES